MFWETFEAKDVGKIWKPDASTGKYSGGQVTIIGGSSLFHGAPVLALKAASRLVSMVFFATPEEDRDIANEIKIKSGLSSFIWIPRDEIDSYVSKSDAVLIGPGMMRNKKEGDGFVCDEWGKETREITLRLLEKYSNKQWVVDGGSLQVVEIEKIPKGSIITPNRKEYEMLFGEKLDLDIQVAARQIVEQAKRYEVIILHKDRISLVTDGERIVSIDGGNDGLTSGGIGDLIAGLIVALVAKNEPVLSVSVASFLVKKAAEDLEKERGLMFNSEDIAEQVPLTYGRLVHEVQNV